MPAVYDLANRGLPPGFALVGFARRDWAHQDFAKIVYAAVKEHARTPSERRCGDSSPKASGSCQVRSATRRRSVTWPRRSLISTRPAVPAGTTFYLSIPPGLFQTVVDQLRSHGLAEGIPDGGAGW